MHSRKERKVLILFDDMIADMVSNKKLRQVVTESFIADRKFNIFLVFITQSYLRVSKDVRINTTHFFIVKILSKPKVQQIATNHSSDIDFDEFKRFTAELHSFLIIDTTLPSDDALRFRKNLLCGV